MVLVLGWGALYTSKAPFSGCTKVGKDTVMPSNSRDWLPPVYINERSRLIFTVSTYQGGSRKEKIN